MPGSYAGSTYIGVDPYRSGVRPGVEYEEDEDMQRWAEEKGKLRKRGGATTFKIPDGKGGFSYTLRNAEQYDGPGAAGTQVGLDVDGTTVLGEAMGKTDVIKPRLTKQQAASFKGDYDEYKVEQKTAADELKLREQKAADREQARQDYAFKLQQDRENEKQRRKDQLETPLAGERAQNAQVDLLVEKTNAAKDEIGRQKKGRDTAKDLADMAVMGGDLDGYSKTAEAVIKKSYVDGDDATLAVEKGRAAHKAEVDRIQSLYNQNTPVAVKEADRLASLDNDLQKENYTKPLRDPRAEKMAFDSTVGSFLEGVDKDTKRGWIRTKILGSDRDTLANLDDDQLSGYTQKLRTSIEDLYQQAPYSVDLNAIKQEIVRRMQAKKVDGTIIAKVIQDLEGIL
jgi:hypothetical protein